MSRFINSYIFLLVVGFLAGCNTQQTVPESIIVAQVPVSVSCVDAPDPPHWQLGTGAVIEDAELIKQVLHDAMLAKGYVKELEAMLSACR